MVQELKRLITAPLVLLAAALIWLWEWMWDPLAAFMRSLMALPLLQALNARLRALPPFAALACFAVPVVVMLPFKVVGLLFIAHGAFVPGVITFMSAKVVGTALVAHIFNSTKPQLLTITWFRRSYEAITRFKEWAFGAVRQHPAYIAVRRKLHELRLQAGAFRRQVIQRLRSAGKL
ncbi:MAG: hypothetical protein WBP72_12410 [Rhodocyclaceae bacterium]